MDIETSLVVIENPVAVFTDNQVDEVLSKIEQAAGKLVFDIETAKGRKECASAANQVAKVKVFLDNTGKDLVADWKKKAQVVDADRKKIRDTLDELKLKVRAPLTEYEQEQERIEAAHESVRSLFARAANKVGLGGAAITTVDDCAGMIHIVKETVIDPALSVNQIETLEKARNTALEILTHHHNAIVEQEEIRAENERLRKEAAERAEKDRIERLKEQARREAKLEAERAAQERQEHDRRMLEEAKAREEQAKLREQKALAEKEEAERRAAEAIAEAQRSANAVIPCDAKDTAIANAIEDIHAVLWDAHGCDVIAAEKVVEAIDAGRIRWVSINY